MVLSALTALFWSVRYHRTLGIRASEARRYYVKSINLALCYRAFDGHGLPQHPEKAGRAAFLSCAYDVTSDWRGFTQDATLTFETVLRQLAPSPLADLALTLYHRDRLAQLDDDGLERGAVSLEFICGLMGSSADFDPFTVPELGLLCQIVDDVLDLEGDVQRDELNCLRTPNRGLHLAALLQAIPAMNHVFRRRFLMRLVIGRAARKAELLLARDSFDRLVRECGIGATSSR